MRITRRGAGPQAPYGPTLVLTVSLAVAGFLIVMALLLLIAHPQNAGLGAAAAKVVNQQNQNAKTSLYVIAFLVLLPGAVILAPRLADQIFAGPNRAALAGLSYGLAGGLCLLLVVVRISRPLPWGDGIAVLLAVLVPAGVLGALALRRAAAARPWPAAAWLAARERAGAVLATVLAFAAILCVTHLGSLGALGLVLGGAGLGAGLALRDRIVVPRLNRGVAAAFDAVAVVLLLLAVVDVIVYRSGTTLPNAFFPPGVYQFQQDWIIGPANQLVAGGAVMVNDPVSQYGVGMLYFLDGWFHIAPIGYGTFGLLDGILTALVYLGGYCVVRIAGARPALAAGALAVAVLAFVYHLVYPVGALPEQGPLRFGVPMALLVARVVAARWPAAARAARTTALVVLGVAALWALEAFVYTTATYLVIVGVEALLEPEGIGRARLIHELGLGLGAVLSAHLLFALSTFAGSGHLPAWREYLAYIDSLLFGGKEGSITYGFDRWSPGLAMGVASACSAAALVLLLTRARALAREQRVTVVAIAGMTMYEIAVFSYTDSRSSTYLLPYVALPLLLAMTLWIVLLNRARARTQPVLRIGFAAFAGAVAVILVSAAWTGIGSHFSDSALAHSYPGGGLGGAIRRLWHSPVIDPRAPDGQRVLARYFPARRAIVLLPTAQELGIEILMRSGKANRLFIGDPVMDDFIPQVWVPQIRRQIERLHTGDRVLTTSDALPLIAMLRRLGPFDPLKHQTGSAIPTAVYNAPQVIWTLQQIDLRYLTRPVYRDGVGYVVLEVVGRR